jgi:hypothetical protein
MRIEKRIAIKLIDRFGYESAVNQTRTVLETVMKLDSFHDIEAEHFFREILLELMNTRN